MLNMLNGQQFAQQIEYKMRSVFECERGGIGGLVESDYIRSYPFTAMISTLTYLYGCHAIKDIEAISNFFADWQYYSQWSIDDILKFENNVRQIQKVEYTIEYQNGEEAMKAMIDSFYNLCKNI